MSYDHIRGRIWPGTVERDTAAPEWLAELLAEVDLLRTLEKRHEQKIEDGQILHITLDGGAPA